MGTDVMEAKCSECGMNTEVSFMKRSHGKDVEETYIKCGICHVETTCYVVNDKVRRLQAQRNEETSTRGRKRLYNRITVLMEGLKAKYGQ